MKKVIVTIMLLLAMSFVTANLSTINEPLVKPNGLPIVIGGIETTNSSGHIIIPIGDILPRPAEIVPPVPKPVTIGAPTVGITAKIKAENKTVNIACIQAAIDKRDTAIMAAVDAYDASLKSELSTRKEALKAGWAITDAAKRKQAIKAAWDAFKGSWRTAGTKIRNDRNVAWNQFQKDAKTCNIDAGVDTTSSSVDQLIQ